MGREHEVRWRVRTVVSFHALTAETRSDRIPWPDASVELLPDTSPPAPDNLRAQVEDCLTLWCSHPDCLTAQCFSHGTVLWLVRSWLAPNIPTDTEQVNLDSIVDRGSSLAVFSLLPVEVPCSQDCVLKHLNEVEVYASSSSSLDLVLTRAEVRRRLDCARL